MNEVGAKGEYANLSRPVKHYTLFPVRIHPGSLLLLQMLEISIVRVLSFSEPYLAHLARILP